ncbi:zinc transporter ZupT [Bacteroides faecis]|uniref:zinc transporter ZupT n=1 Tax=Bacteroides faecis TaxID=674529 RepID=UPI0021667DB8|nr:zinc transporter ZupT [Bacteroides faecis]MCS2912232.1 zinc transporter ZupT [Bacteroides faecis]
MSQPVLIAFFLTSFAGISTGIGSAIAFFAKRTNTSFLSLSLGFSTAVMIYMSFANLFASSCRLLPIYMARTTELFIPHFLFFGGIVLILLIDKLIPHYENPHEMHRVEEMSLKEERKTEIKPQLLRVDVVTALVLAIHNFPEGMVTFLAALKDINIAIPIACAIAIHNIPEGISVSVPIYYATGNRKRAFWLSFLSGLAEPVGAVIGYLILAPFLNDHVFGVIFGMIAGIMVFISLDELLPAAEEYGKHHHTIYGLVAGMAVMALNLLMLC